MSTGLVGDVDEQLLRQILTVPCAGKIKDCEVI